MSKISLDFYFLKFYYFFENFHVWLVLNVSKISLDLVEIVGPRLISMDIHDFWYKIKKKCFQRPQSDNTQYETLILLFHIIYSI